MSLRRKIRLLALFNFFDAFRFSAAILIIYFARVSGSYALGMSVFSINSLSQLVFDIPTGMISDALGRKPVIICGAIASAGFTVFYAIGQNYWYLFAGAAIEGLARALYSGTRSALLYETLAEHDAVDRYAEYSGKINSLEPAAFATATVAGSVIAAYSFHLVFWVTLVPQFIALCITLAIYEPKVVVRTKGTMVADLRESAAEFVHNRRLALITLGTALREAFGESAFQYQPAFYLTVWPTWALGIAGSLTHAGSAVSFYVSGRVIARFQALRVLMGEIIIGRVINAVALIVPTVVSPLLMSVTSLFYGPSQVAREALLQQEFTERQRATMGSVASQVSNVLFATAAVLVGLCADRIGPISTLLLLQGLVFLPLWLYIRVFRHHSHVEERR
jgi:MFS family permease